MATRIVNTWGRIGGASCSEAESMLARVAALRARRCRVARAERIGIGAMLSFRQPISSASARGSPTRLTLADGTQSISDWDNVKTGSVPGITN